MENTMKSRFLSSRTKGLPIQKQYDYLSIQSNHQMNRIDQYELPIDAYVLDQVIGQGSYATVYLAHREGMNEKYAIKTYDKDKLDDIIKKENLAREIAILKQLNHQNVIKLHQVIDTPTQVYLITEFISFTSLHKYIKTHENHRLEESEAKDFFRQIIKGIGYCHRNNIVHRDIKMENILLTYNKKIIIIDFGFSIKIRKNQVLEGFCGTPSYMAPELLQKKYYLGKKVDIWALGILLYKMLCGIYPFQGKDNHNELYENIIKGDYEIPSYVTPGAKSLIKKILRIDPNQRPTCNNVRTMRMPIALLTLMNIDIE